MKMTKRQKAILDAWKKHGSVSAVARALGLDQSGVSKTLDQLGVERRRGKPSAVAAPLAADAKLVDDRRRKAVDAELKRLAADVVALRDRDRLFDALTGAPLPPVARHEFTSGIREATPVVLLSDLHVETEVRPGSVPYDNAFNLKIAEHRLRRTFAAVDWQCSFMRAERAFAVRHLVVWLGGDLITNHLHPENVETAQLGPADATLWVLDHLYQGIQSLLDTHEFETIDLVCSVGNHGRTTDRMRSATATDHSWEWIIYQVLAMRFKGDPRVRVLADRSTHQYHQIYDFNVHFHHGHEIKYNGGVGGISIPVLKAVAQWNLSRFCHYHCFGHWHQRIDLGSAAVNGSLIGYDSYSMSIKATPEPAQQSIFAIDSKRGKCLASPLWSVDRAEENEL